MRRELTIADLSDAREIAFVSAVLDLGGLQHAAQAALRAGYGKTLPEAERSAAFLLGAPRICRAIATETKGRFDAATATAFQTLVEVCADPDAPANARVAAAKDILDRSSVGPPISRSANVHVGDNGLADWIKKLDEIERAERQTLDAQAVKFSP